MSPQDKLRIHKIDFDESKIEMPKDMFFYGGGVQYGVGIGGIIGYQIAGSIESKDTAIIKSIDEKNGTNIKKIFASEASY